MTTTEEFWFLALIWAFTGIALFFLAFFLVYWIMKFAITKPIEHILRNMRKEGKITNGQFEYLRGYIWDRHRAH